jgi:hypothetical protein
MKIDRKSEFSENNFRGEGSGGGRRESGEVNLILL